MKLLIDATNIKSGGGTTHLNELLGQIIQHNNVYKINTIIVVSSSETLNTLPSSTIIVQETAKFLNKRIIHRFLWTFFSFSKLISRYNPDIMLCLGGTYLGSFKPVVAFSHNMLFFDSKESSRYGVSLFRFKFPLMYLMQKQCFKKSAGLIFISEFAKRMIFNKHLPPSKPFSIIHHGVSNRFKQSPKVQKAISDYSAQNPFKLLYVSSVDAYKHQWHLVNVVGRLRRENFMITLDMVGASLHNKSIRKMKDAILVNDSSESFIKFHGTIGYHEIQDMYKNADLFVFCSTCENMPNILVEAMSAGLPIASSSYGPMPEFLEDSAVYFDPTNEESLYYSLKDLILNREKRTLIADNAYTYADKYSWKKCADQTITFLRQVLENERNLSGSIK